LFYDAALLHWQSTGWPESGELYRAELDARMRVEEWALLDRVVSWVGGQMVRRVPFQADHQIDAA